MKDNSPLDTRESRMTLGAMLRHALSDLVFRMGLTLLVMVTVAIAAAYTLCFSFYGTQIYGFQRRLLDEHVPTIVTATNPDIINRELRFTAATLSALLEKPYVVEAYPKIEQGVRISLDDRASIPVTGEGLSPTDPRSAASRLLYGAGFDRDAERAILLDQGLFEKMGGHLSSAGPVPASVVLSVSRIAGGEEQTLRFRLPVSGILRRQPTEKVYLPLPLSLLIDQWTSHKVDSIDRDAPGSNSVGYPSCWVYVPVAQVGQLRREIEHFGIAATAAGSVTTLEAPSGDIWARINETRKGGPPLGEIISETAAQAAGRVYASQVWDLDLRGEIVRIAALPHHDPRWGDQGTQRPAFKELVPRQASLTHHQRLVSITRVRVRPDPLHIPVDADYVCTLETLSWLAFDARTSGLVQSAVYVPTDSLDPPANPGATHAGISAPTRHGVLLHGQGVAAGHGGGTQAHPAKGPMLETAITPNGWIAKIVYPETATAPALRGLAEAYPTLRLLDPERFDDEVFAQARAAGALNLPGITVRDVACSDPFSYFTLAGQLTAAGYQVEPLTEISRNTYARYRVTDPGQPDGVMSDELMAILESTKPTFAWVTPHLRTGARIGPADTVLVATDSADPWRFSASLLHGSWIAPGAVDQVIVPAAMLKAALPEGQEHSAIGKGLTVQFTRPRSLGVQEDRLSMTLVIAGISEAEVVFAPTRLLCDVERWREGKVLFNTTAGRFETPRAIYERSGHVRATLVASDIAALEPLVRRLEAIGYQVDSSLAQMSGLRRLGQVIVLIVVVFTLGCCLNAVIAVLVTSMMRVRTKAYEIGLLKAHGVSGGEILKMFCFQGLLIGGAGFLTACVAVVVLEPFIRRALATVFGMSLDAVIEGKIYGTGTWWLFGLTLLVAMGFSLAGIIIPALNAYRLSPVEALHQRE